VIIIRGFVEISRERSLGQESRLGETGLLFLLAPLALRLALLLLHVLIAAHHRELLAGRSFLLATVLLVAVVLIIVLTRRPLLLLEVLVIDLLLLDRDHKRFLLRDFQSLDGVRHSHAIRWLLFIV